MHISRRALHSKAKLPSTHEMTHDKGGRWWPLLQFSQAPHLQLTTGRQTGDHKHQSCLSSCGQEPPLHRFRKSKAKECGCSLTWSPQQEGEWLNSVALFSFGLPGVSVWMIMILLSRLGLRVMVVSVQEVSDIADLSFYLPKAVSSSGLSTSEIFLSLAVSRIPLVNILRSVVPIFMWGLMLHFVPVSLFPLQQLSMAVFFSRNEQEVGKHCIVPYREGR